MRPALRAWILAVALASVIVHRESVAYAQADSSPSPAPSTSPSPSPSPAELANARPRLLRFVQAEYPADARASGTEASVVLLLTVDAQGHVTDASIAQSAGDAFDAAAIAAARQFEFSPARQDGLAVEARIRYRYRFTLHLESSAPALPMTVLRGVVRNAANLPVAQATLRAQFETGEPEEQTTSGSGEFRFSFHATGRLIVHVTAADMRPFEAEENLVDRDDLQVVYRLAAAVTPASSGPPTASRTAEEQAVTVRATRPPREVSRTTLDREEVRLLPGAGGDALRSIQNLPSVARPTALLGDLIIRGSAPGDTAVFADGTDLPLLYHFSGAASVIPTEMLDRIDFYPGNFSARFGRATGGIVDVGLRSPRTQGYHAVAIISTLDVSLFAEGPVTPTLSVAIAARRSWIDAFLTPILENLSGISIVAAPVYWDYQAVAEWRPTPHHKLRLAIFGDDDSLAAQLIHPNDSMPIVAGRFSLATRFHVAQLSWQHDIAPGTQQRVMMSIAWTNTEFGGSGQFEFHDTEIPVNFRYELSHTFSRFLRAHTGLDAQFGPAHESFSIPRLDDSDTSTAPRVAANINAFLYRPAWYAEAEITPLPRLRFVPGVRLDYFRQNHSAILQPRFAARWEVVPNWTIKGGMGLYSQPPGYDQTSTAPNTFIPGQTIGNPNLATQTAMHYALGIEHSFSLRFGNIHRADLFLSVEGFYKTIDGIPVAASPFALTSTPPAPPYSSTGVGRVYGVDVLFRHRPSAHFFGWIAYTLMRSERRDTVTGQWYPFDYDQTHILTIVATCIIGWGFSFGARFRYVTGNPTTPYVGSYYNADSMLYSPIEGVHNSVRVRDFHQLDLRIDKTFRFSWGSVGAFLEVINVYNQPNQEGLSYNFNYTRSVPVTGLPIFPNIGLRGEL